MLTFDSYMHVHYVVLEFWSVKFSQITKNTYCYQKKLDIWISVGTKILWHGFSSNYKYHCLSWGVKSPNTFIMLYFESIVSCIAYTGYFCLKQAISLLKWIMMAEPASKKYVFRMVHRGKTESGPMMLSRNNGYTVFNISQWDKRSWEFGKYLTRVS